MIIVNGYIRIVEAASGYDKDGNPVESYKVAGEPIPCNFVRSSYNGKGYYEDGRFYHGSYTVLIDKQPFEPCRLVLTDLDNNQLGEYDVRRNGIVQLASVEATQLTL